MKHTAILFTTGMAAATAALGQSIDIEPIPDLPIRSTPPGNIPNKAPANGAWRISAGAGVSYVPSYEGSARHRLRLIPLLEASKGNIFISPLRGIGYNFSGNRNIQFGPRLALGRGRKQNVDPRLNGMGDIAYTAEIGVFLNMRLAPWYVSSGLTTSSHGTHFELGGGIGIPLSASDRIRIGTNFNWGNTQYNQTYFGVTPAQATASGGVLTAYSASAGIKDYALTANWRHSYNKEWFSSTGFSFKRLTGSAQYSPLTMNRTMNSINFLLGYRF